MSIEFRSMLNNMASHGVSDSDVIPYLSDTFFNGNRDIAETIQEYNQGLSICYLANNIFKKNESSQTNDLIIYLFQNHKIFNPTLQINDIKDPIKLKKCILLSIENNWQAKAKFKEKYMFEVINRLVLSEYNFLFKVNEDDPLSLDEISDEDLFVSNMGERFSLTYLANYHNSRLYRGTRGEQHNSKFIVNPLTNTFFPAAEVFRIIIATLQANIALSDLHKQRLAPEGDATIQHCLQTRWFRSLNGYYQFQKLLVELNFQTNDPAVKQRLAVLRNT